MKNLLLVWNAALTLVVIYLLYSVMPQTTDTTDAQSEDSTVTSVLTDTIEFEKAKVVYINNDTLFKYLDMYKDLEDELIAEKNRLESQYRRELQKLEKEYLEAQENEWKMTQAQIQEIQQRLMSEQQRLVKMEQDLTVKFGKKESDMVQKIKDTIEDFLKRNQEEYGYDFVLGKSNLGGIHYANAVRDVTREVVDGLNQEYQAKKAVKKGEQK